MQDYNDLIKYRQTDAYRRQERNNTRRFLTIAEMLTAGHLDKEQTGPYLDMLMREMGDLEFSKWLTTFEPPLHDRSDAEIRRVIFSKLQSELAK